MRAGKSGVAGWAVMTAAALGVIWLTAGFGPPPENDLFFRVNRSIDMFGRVYREIALNYVDEIDPDRFMEAGIDGMLDALDPYTVFIDRENGDEVELITNGKYGGIGITIGLREGTIQVLSVMDGYSAQRQGVIPGDRILEVDGIAVASRKPDDIRGLTRGDPGTEVRLLIEREGEKAPLTFVLIREEIRIKNVTFADFLEPGIAYIRLERFSRTAGEEVRQALAGLQVRDSVRGVILDLRGNPGGLLDAAVDVTSKFVPRGSLIVSTRGRRADSEKTYLSSEEPMFGRVPLVLLTDQNSASASEIVSGAVQDLDRGLIVGTRTFGKGLVQTIVPLDEGAQLKITTARYYTPSGRSIQEIDYLERGGTGLFPAAHDSTKRAYTTAGGRSVSEHGGITPDSVVEDTDVGPMVRQLARKSLFFRFANAYMAEHRGMHVTTVTDSIVEAFRVFLKEAGFDFQEETVTRLAELRSMAEKYHYSEAILKDLGELESDLAAEKETGFDRYRDHITRALGMELMARSGGEQGRIRASFPGDVVLETGVGLLKNRQSYHRKLTG